MELESKKLDVLDNGFVRYIDHMGSDLTVVNSARVSFSKESSWEKSENNAKELCLSEKDKKLVKYLADHKHWTPFAHPQISLHFKAPIFIRTQLFKHKVGFVENEISRRYVKDKPEFYVPFWRSAPTNGAKQGSSAPMKYTDHITGYYQNICDDAVDLYLHLMEEGVAPEQARSVLPQGTYTEWYWTGSLASYSRVYKQRVDSNAQWEVRVYAETIGKILKELFPVSWEALVAD
jgi:thymidylate synthase (FAD)